MPKLLEFYSIEKWLPKAQSQRYIELLFRTRQKRSNKITWRQAECFVRLWVYLFLKDCQTRNVIPNQPLKKLAFPQGLVECSCSEAAEVFYFDKKNGSARSAGMMLNRLINLGLIEKWSDRSCTQIKIQPLLELLKHPALDSEMSFEPDAFDPDVDAVPIASLLSRNYDKLNHNTETIPHRITKILREWAEFYVTGMRVLRRNDNQNPVGFYVLYPVKKESEKKFFDPPSQGLYLGQDTKVDPFEMALPKNSECEAVFIRSWIIDSWIIDSPYGKQAQSIFLEDIQQTLKKMKKDFPKLCRMFTMIIRTSDTKLAKKLGFQSIVYDSSLYWMYQVVEQFLKLDMQEVVMKLEEF